MNFGELWLMAPEGDRGVDPSEDLSLFLSYLPKKSKNRKEVRTLERNSLETTDIFRGAFFLCKGGDLCGIRFKEHGQRLAYFLIKGKDLARLDKEYRAGRALVNPLQFRESLNHLRDMLFKTLRNDMGRSSYDREGDYRSCKAQR